MSDIKFWLEQGVDGFRIDALRVFETDGLPNELYVNINGDRLSRVNLIIDQMINRVCSGISLSYSYH